MSRGRRELSGDAWFCGQLGDDQDGDCDSKLREHATPGKQNMVELAVRSIDLALAVHEADANSTNVVAERATQA